MSEFPEDRETKRCPEHRPGSGSTSTHQETECDAVQHHGRSLHKTDSSTLSRQSLISPNETHCEILDAYDDAVNKDDKAGIGNHIEESGAAQPTPGKMVEAREGFSMAVAAKVRAGCVEVNRDGSVLLGESRGVVLPCTPLIARVAGVDQPKMPELLVMSGDEEEEEVEQGRAPRTRKSPEGMTQE